MAWTDDDDSELQKYLDKLQTKQKEFQSQLNPIEIIINNIRQIQSRDVTSYTEKREQIITKIPPKDKWNNNMKDVDRLKIKDECINKTNELLGEIDE